MLTNGHFLCATVYVAYIFHILTTTSPDSESELNYLDQTYFVFTNGGYHGSLLHLCCCFTAFANETKIIMNCSTAVG